LKKTTRDTEIESLITKAKNVLIESPEEKAVRFTYRQRKREEARRDAYAFRLAREAEEARIERELEEEERAAEEAKARKERERIEAEEEKKRLRKAEEEAKKAEAAAEKQRLKEEAKKAAAAEAEERRIAHEAKLAAKRASLAEEFEDEDEDLIDALQLISTLSADWEEKIHREMSVKNLAHTVATSPDGAELSRRDFGSLLPQEGTSDDPSGWLNDEMINGFLSTIVTTKKNREGHKKGRDVPTFEAFASAWFTTYKQQGMGKLARWSKRKGIDGKNLLKCHRIFFPINTGNHWMLLIISPAFRTIEFLDSLQSSANRTKFFSIAREWLQMELQSNYKASEWTELDSESMRQTNMNDCGVFTCFNALASAKYLSFELVNPNHMDKARKLMAAILIKGRLEGEFKL
jgi:Ulp1 family protease